MAQTTLLDFISKQSNTMKLYTLWSNVPNHVQKKIDFSKNGSYM
jgi:hypothetical protein